MLFVYSGGGPGVRCVLQKSSCQKVTYHLMVFCHRKVSRFDLSKWVISPLLVSTFVLFWKFFFPLRSQGTFLSCGCCKSVGTIVLSSSPPLALLPVTGPVTQALCMLSAHLDRSPAVRASSSHPPLTLTPMEMLLTFCHEGSHLEEGQSQCWPRPCSKVRLWVQPVPCRDQVLTLGSSGPCGLLWGR